MLGLPRHLNAEVKVHLSSWAVCRITMWNLSILSNVARLYDVTLMPQSQHFPEHCWGHAKSIMDVQRPLAWLKRSPFAMPCRWWLHATYMPDYKMVPSMAKRHITYNIVTPFPLCLGTNWESGREEWQPMLIASTAEPGHGLAGSPGKQQGKESSRKQRKVKFSWKGGAACGWQGNWWGGKPEEVGPNSKRKPCRASLGCCCCFLAGNTARVELNGMANSIH